MSTVVLLTGADALAKRGALAALVRETLARHDAAFAEPGRVVEAVDVRTLLHAAPADRARAMGHPARFAEVLWRQGAAPEDGVGTVGGGAATAPHTFAVNVYWGYGPESEDPFTAALESLDGAAPGLLAALRGLSHLVVRDGPADGSGGSRHVVEVDGPARVRTVLALADATAVGPAGYEHQCGFVVTLS